MHVTQPVLHHPKHYPRQCQGQATSRFAPGSSIFTIRTWLKHFHNTYLARAFLQFVPSSCSFIISTSSSYLRISVISAANLVQGSSRSWSYNNGVRAANSTFPFHHYSLPLNQFSTMAGTSRSNKCKSLPVQSPIQGVPSVVMPQLKSMFFDFF